MVTDNDLVGYFHRHVVPVFFTIHKGNDIQNFFITAFVLSVQDRWFLITAGHCIREIETLVNDGYRITRSLLFDSLGLGAKHPDPIPFVYSNARPMCLSDDYAFDYGVMSLSPYYKQLLESNNVEALNENVWKTHPPKVDFYMLLGIPAELVRVKTESIEMSPVLYFVDPISQKPAEFTDVDVPLFYGRIKMEEGLHSIKGMSGGPIFAFYTNEKGENRYWLTALQSRWLPESHFIAACPTTLLGYFLEKVINRDAR